MKKPKSEGLLDLYREIWSEREHVSFISGRSVPYFSPSNFIHVLAKGQNKYPKFKKFKRNIVIGHPEEHHLIDNGTIAQREAYKQKYPTCDWVGYFALRDELVELYKDEFGL